MYILWQTLNQKDIHVKKDGPIVDQDKSTMWGATRSKREYTINTKSTLGTICYRRGPSLEDCATIDNISDYQTFGLLRSQISFMLSQSFIHKLINQKGNVFAQKQICSKVERIPKLVLVKLQEFSVTSFDSDFTRRKNWGEAWNFQFNQYQNLVANFCEKKIKKSFYRMLGIDL